MNIKFKATVFTLAFALTGCSTASVKPEQLSLRANHVQNGVVSFAVIDESGKAQTDVPVTFGQIFKDGDMPADAHLRALLDGKPIPIQVDRKATNGDGSLRHAVVTVQVPELPASGAQVVTLATGGHAASGAPVTLDALLDTDFDASVSLNVKGDVLTADARKLLEQARAHGTCQPWGKQCSLWLAGPLVSEWIVGGPLESKNGPSPHLAAYFYVRAYAGHPVHRVRVNVVIENDWTWVKNPHNITYDATITVGNNVYHKADIEHYAHTRWHRVLWWGDKADVYARLDGQYIQASKAVSNYADVHPTDAFLSSVRQSVEPMSHGDQTQHMAEAGAQHAIGPLPRWTVAYLLSMDPRAFRWMLANDDAAGSYDVFYRDKNTGRPVTILDYPYMTLLGVYTNTYNPHTKKHENFPKCDGDCRDPNRPNAAHEPSIGYVSYMVTGDFYYLEQLQFWADWNALQMNPGYRDHAKGLLKPNQVRGQAWGMRTLGDVAYITPDKSPLKPYFVGMLNNNLAWYNSQYTDNPDANKLGVLTSGCCATHYEHHTSVAPWQDDFFTWAIGHLADLGFKGADALLQWKAKFPVGRMVAPGFCYVYGSDYTLPVTDGRHDAMYDSFHKVYIKAVSAKVAKMKCGGDAMADHLGRHYKPGDMYGFPWSPTGYPANMQPALAASVDAGVPGAAEAWKIFTSRPTTPDYTNYANWDIVPRPEAKRGSGGQEAAGNGKASAKSKRSFEVSMTK
ncbi:MAG TPA: hypothetical protein VFK24_02020 [Gammaproteobacteria bacterium]|nr:hypothetical protein [Gammaproteobacteria bacterium]